MKILFVVPYTPNLIRVRPYNLIRSLSERGNDVTLLTLYESEAELAEAKALEAFCSLVVALPLSRWQVLWNCLSVLPGRQPLQTAYSWQPNLGQILVEMLKRQNNKTHFDIVHVEHLRGVRYGLFLQKNLNGNSPNSPIVWDSVDCISHLFRQAMVSSQSRFGRWMTRFDLGRTERMERLLMNKFQQILVTSPEDKKAFLSLAGNNRSKPPISVLPNGVDLDYFKPCERTVRESATLVVSGKMSYHANITMTLHLVRDIMPLVWSRRPDVKLMIVGKDPSPEIKSFGDHPNITVTGTVADIRPYLREATVAVAPVEYGAGIQNKILEAMACATPVVASPQTVSALSAVAGRELFVGQNSEHFAECVLELLEDENRRIALGASGRAYTEAHHDWSRIAAFLEDIYRGIISQTN